MMAPAVAVAAQPRPPPSYKVCICFSVQETEGLYQPNSGLLRVVVTISLYANAKLNVRAMWVDRQQELPHKSYELMFRDLLSSSVKNMRNGKNDPHHRTKKQVPFSSSYGVSLFWDKNESWYRTLGVMRHPNVPAVTVSLYANAKLIVRATGT
jgi:hypothetical protein